MSDLIDVFFYGYYLNANFLQELGANPLNPRPARLHGWQLHLGGDSSLIVKPDSFADGMIYSLKQTELDNLYSSSHITPFNPRSVEVRLLVTDQLQQVLCYFAAVRDPEALPQSPKYVRIMLEAMRSYNLDTQIVEKIYSKVNKKAVIHIPHSSIQIPTEYRSAFLLSENELNDEILCMTDWYTDELFTLNNSFVTSVQFPVSRLLVDPERFVDDTQEEMALKGMGVIYTRTSSGISLRQPLSTLERQILLNRYYLPHHERLAREVAKVLDNHNRALLIDGHSFPEHALPYENATSARPDICLGADEFHTPQELIDLAVQLFKQEGFNVNINQPFSGALVPSAYYQQDHRVHALMIEVNRKLYMDESIGMIPRLAQPGT